MYRERKNHEIFTFGVMPFQIFEPFIADVALIYGPAIDKACNSGVSLRNKKSFRVFPYTEGDALVCCTFGPITFRFDIVTSIQIRLPDFSDNQVFRINLVASIYFIILPYLRLNLYIQFQ